MHQRHDGDGAKRQPATCIGLERVSLFLDLDGTLAEIETQPELVGPDARRTGLLHSIGQALSGRLAIVSGRSISEIDRIVERSVQSVAGLHGLERRDALGLASADPAAPGLAEARRRAQAFVAEQPGALFEDKGLAIAVHFRAVPDLHDEAEAFARGLAADHDLSLQAGKMVFELRTPGADKGDMVRAFMSEEPFRTGIPIFVGDDLTDEHAFAAATELGGMGILVGPPRETLALGRLNDVAGVLDWLEQGVTTGTLTTGDAA